jgi:hypothetical protein
VGLWIRGRLHGGDLADRTQREEDAAATTSRAEVEATRKSAHSATGPRRRQEGGAVDA